MFDGQMCKLKLKAPDGSFFFFFSNCPQDISGPNNELQIGVNLGVDWCILFFHSYELNNSVSGFLTFVATSHCHTPHVSLPF